MLSPIRKLYPFFLILALVAVFFLQGYYYIVVFPGIVISILGLREGGENVFDEATSLASRIGKGPKFAGTVILSLAAIVDEIAVISVALVQGKTALSFGALMGSNIAVLFAFLILFPFSASGFRIDHFKIDSAMVLATSVILLFAYVFLGTINWELSIILLAVLAIYMFASREEEQEVSDSQGSFNIIRIAMAVVFLAFSSIDIVYEADFTASFFKIGPLYSGILVTGIAGSIPEFFLIYYSVLRRRAEVGTGVVTGSTVYKSTLLVSAVALVSPVILSNALWSITSFVVLAAVLSISSLIGPRRILSFLTILAFAVVTVVML